MPEKPTPEARIFYVESRFERMARRPGGVAREQALANAQAHVEELKSDFTGWLDTELRRLRAVLAEIESNPSDVVVLERADNNCSQLRDLGATMGFELITFVAESLCTILETVKAGAAYDKNVVDCHIDALFLVRTEPYRNLGPGQVPDMSSGLRRIVELAMRTQPDQPTEETGRSPVCRVLASRDDDGRR